MKIGDRVKLKISAHFGSVVIMQGDRGKITSEFKKSKKFKFDWNVSLDKGHWMPFYESELEVIE